MKRLAYTLLLLGFTQLPASGFAETCERTLVRHKNTQIHRYQNGDGICYLSVANRAGTGMVYRNYLFSDLGLMMVFNSYGSGSTASSTGARDYFFFPQQQGIFFKALDNTVSIRHADTDFVFDATSSELLSVGGYSVKVDPKINKTNKGGVEIFRSGGVMFDSGFRMGESPSANSKGKTVVLNSLAEKCTVNNREVFNYTQAGATPKYSNDELTDFLDSRCPSSR